MTDRPRKSRLPRRSVPPRVRKVLGAINRVVLRPVLWFVGVVAVLVAISWWRAPGTSTLIVATSDARPVIREVTGLFPVVMRAVVTPTTTEQVAEAMRSSTGPVSIGGGRYSMGGQTGTPGGLQLDLRKLAGVRSVDTIADTMRVYAGTRWRDVQEALDPLGRAVKVMQTYNNFTVGGALGVNAHGRYIGLGPVSQTVRSMQLVLADGSVVEASRTVRPELYSAALGGYGAIGVITEATLEIAKNDRIQRTWTRMPLDAYQAFFDSAIAGTAASDTAVIFHNGDLAPPEYDQVGALTYRRTARLLTDTTHLLPRDQQSAIRRGFFGGLASTTWRPMTAWMRKTVVDPIVWSGSPVTWRNLEASYDVSELEPTSRAKTTFVLQEYFIPKAQLAPAVRALGAVLRKHEVKAVNISIRHALADTVPLLTWAPTETYALVLYYAQGTQPEDLRTVGIWTREAIDSVLHYGGRYYLPYQAHATRAQFAQAYPRADSLFALKAKFDPTGRFTNTLWDLYAPVPGTDTVPTVTSARYPVQMPAEVRLMLEQVPEYQRNSLASVVAHPEWDLVWSSDAQRDWLRSGGAPSGFAWMQSVGTFWRSYRAATVEANRIGSVPDGFHAMLMVIGVSTTVEYALTGFYENTIGRLTEWLGGHRTGADKLAAQLAVDYSALIHTEGWFKFGFWPYVGRIWQQPMGNGGQVLRSLERRVFLSLLWSVKAGYAQLLTVALANEAPAALRREIVVVSRDTARARSSITEVHALARGYERISVPRYAAFEAGLYALAGDAAARVMEINGSPTAVLTARVPAGTPLPAAVQVIAEYRAVPDAPNATPRQRVLISMPTFELLDVLRAMRALPGVTIDHIYDY